MLFMSILGQVLCDFSFFYIVCITVMLRYLLECLFVCLSVCF